MMVNAGEIVNLRCEYLDSPLGIDVAEPRLTWEFSDPLFTPVRCRIEISEDSLFTSPLALEIPGGNKVKANIPAVSAKKWYWRVISDNASGHRISSPTAFFETGMMNQADWKADWITDSKDISYGPAPVLSTRFTAPHPQKGARVYVSAVGYYDMEINGERVGNHHMDPGFTNFNKRNLYSTHDVTDLIHEGENSIVVTMGNGFANVQSADSWWQEKAPWRTRPMLKCEVWVDGKPVAVTDSTWQTSEGKVTFNNLYSGVHTDNRIISAITGNARVMPDPSCHMKWQATYPILPVETITPKLLKNFGDTVYIFDMGKNIAGVSRLSVKGKKGTRLSISHGELLKENGRLEPGNINIYYHPLRDDESFQTDVFTLSGNPTGESFMPPFTYHGFRYAEIRSSRPVKLKPGDVVGVMMHTAVPRNGYFRCSDSLLNRIYDATMLSYVDNLHSIPTDCPQREKNGWTADAHAAIDLALLNYDGITFYEKWLDDWTDSQQDNGNVPGIIPTSGWGYGEWPGPVWDAGLFIIPLAIYDYYGDDSALRKMWPAMMKYTGWLESVRKEDGIFTNGIGDWLPYATSTPTDFTSTLYAYADYKMLSRIALILGKDPAPFERKHNELASLINTRFYDAENGLYSNGSQAAQAIALYWDVVPETERERVASNLNRLITDNSYAPDFGLLGTKSVLRMLTRYGYTDTAWRLATRTDAPSWGYWIEKQGYTTLPETWTLSPEFRDASLNHVFFGDIAAWMTSEIAGLNYDSDHPGFEHVIIKPTFFAGLQWAEASHHSVRGEITTRWERHNGNINISVELPSGVTATVVTDSGNHELTAGSHSLCISN